MLHLTKKNTHKAACCSRFQSRNSITETFFSTFNEKLSPAAGSNQNIPAVPKRTTAKQIASALIVVVGVYIPSEALKQPKGKWHASIHYGSCVSLGYTHRPHRSIDRRYTCVVSVSTFQLAMPSLFHRRFDPVVVFVMRTAMHVRMFENAPSAYCSHIISTAFEYSNKSNSNYYGKKATIFFLSSFVSNKICHRPKLILSPALTSIGRRSSTKRRLSRCFVYLDNAPWCKAQMHFHTCNSWNCLVNGFVLGNSHHSTNT